jgi:hypothetical protein
MASSFSRHREPGQRGAARMTVAWRGSGWGHVRKVRAEFVN